MEWYRYVQTLAVSSAKTSDKPHLSSLIGQLSMCVPPERLAACWQGSLLHSIVVSVHKRIAILTLAVVGMVQCIYLPLAQQTAGWAHACKMEQDRQCRGQRSPFKGSSVGFLLFFSFGKLAKTLIYFSVIKSKKIN